MDSVLLLAFGGPTAPHEIRPFLETVARGRRIPPERLEEVARHYERLPGGRSPLNALTERQAEGLRRALAAAGRALPVFVGMRSWHPFVHDTLAAMASQGLRRAVGIILSSFRCEASWDRYVRDVADARARTPGAPEVLWAPPWFARARFVAAVADCARRALAEVPAERRAWTPLVFTAHSIPVGMAEASSYVADFAAAARAVVTALGHARWSLAYQSRSGPPGDAWLEPDVTDVLRRLGADGERDAVVVPIGFVCDHVEVLYDLDVAARAIAAESGVALHRAPAVNDHPEFIALLADLVREAADGEAWTTATTPSATPGAPAPGGGVERERDAR